MPGTHGWRKLAGIGLLSASLVLAPGGAWAETPYDTEIVDENGAFTNVQAAYVPAPYLYVYLEDAGIPGYSDQTPPVLHQPDDLFIDDRNHLYIADTGNNRIIELDAGREPVRLFGTEDGPGRLKEPHGVFVTKDGMVYAADTKNGRIAVFAADGHFIRDYKKPATDFLPDNFVFEPMKLAVDKRGFLYVATRNGYQGLLLLDDKGGFQGFYGANRTHRSFTETMKRLFYTKEQLRKEIMKVPGSVSNVTMGPDGFLYTTSVGVKQGNVKKLDFFGRDMLSERIRLWKEAAAVDVAVDDKGNMTGLDASTGMIYQYNALGEFMFRFSGKDEGFNKLGLLNQPTGIEVDRDGMLYVLEKERGVIQRFRKTEFANLVHEANERFIAGEYEASAEPWRRVLQLNTKFQSAHLGLAKAAFKERKWKEAQGEFRKAGDRQGYSDAFWYVRTEWMDRHAAGLLTAALIGLAVWLAGKYAWKKAAQRRRPHEYADRMDAETSE